jgi:hypothetical protein
VEGAGGAGADAIEKEHGDGGADNGLQGLAKLHLTSKVLDPSGGGPDGTATTA